MLVSPRCGLAEPATRAVKGEPHTAAANFLGRLSRRTLAFFEVHVGEADHWLPPDIPGTPAPVWRVARPPTNIGLALLANLTAQDFGFIATGPMMTRIANTFAHPRIVAASSRHSTTVRHRYARTLPARYVSTVDSGNLADIC